MKLTTQSIVTFSVGLFLVLICGAVFHEVPKAEFVQWDDDYNIYNNPHLRTMDGASLRWMFTDVSYTPRYRPLNWLSWAVTRHWFGPGAYAFHLGDLLLHVANALLVFWLIRSLLFVSHRGPKLGDTAVTICAGLAALLWAIHPLRVEAVAWANCRMYTQSLFFLLLTVLCYLRFARGVREGDSSGDQRLQTSGAGRICYWLSVVFFTLSLLTYPTGMGLVVVLFVLDVILLRRLPAKPAHWFADAVSRRVWLEKIPFIIVTVAVVVFALLARTNAQGVWVQPNSLAEFPVGQRISQAFYIWAYYVWKPLWPLHLSSSYTTLVSFHPLDWPFLLSATVVVALTWLVIVMRRRWPAAWGLWICHLVLLTPMLGLTEHPHAASDRFSYIVGILFSVMIAFILLELWKGPSQRATSLLVVVGLAGILGVASFRQTYIWQNNNSLFRCMIAQLGDNRHSADLYRRLGDDYARKGYLEEANANYTKALQLSPEHVESHNSLGILLGKRGKFSEAKAQFTEILRLNPADANAHANLGRVCFEQGQLDQAAYHYAAALRSLPDHAGAHRGLGLVLARQGKADEAVTHFQRALASGAEPAETHLNLGHAFNLQGKAAEAIAQYREALKLQPESLDALNNLAWILATSNEAAWRNGAEAVQLASRAVALSHTNDPGALDTLAAAYAEAGQFKEAVATEKQAVNLANAADEILATEARMRLELYERSTPFRMAAGSRGQPAGVP